MKTAIKPLTIKEVNNLSEKNKKLRKELKLYKNELINKQTAIELLKDQNDDLASKNNSLRANYQLKKQISDNLENFFLDESKCLILFGEIENVKPYDDGGYIVTLKNGNNGYGRTVPRAYYMANFEKYDVSEIKKAILKRFEGVEECTNVNTAEV